MLVAQLCPILCNPMDCSLPGSSVHGILQARVLEWVVIPFSRGSSDPGIKSESPALQANSLPLSHQANSRNRVGSQTQVCWTSLLQCSRDFWYIFNGLGGESKDGMGLNRWMVLLFKQQIGTEHWVLFSSPVMILSFGSRGFTCPYFCLRVFEVILTPHPFF